MTKSSNGQGSSDIAIVGMACIFPGAPNLTAYWSNILAKTCSVGDPPPSWGAERYYDSNGQDPERTYTKSGGFLNDLYEFNPNEFGIMPNSVDGGEPDQFLALQVAKNALDDAGYFGEQFDHTNTGVILGHSTYLHRGQATMVQHGVVLDQTVELFKQFFPHVEQQSFDQLRTILKSKLPPFNADTGPGVVPNVMTGRIANRLNLNGPNYLVDAACASSLIAVQAACEELRTGRSDLMLAGGVNASSPAEAFLVFSQLGALSRGSAVKPFSSDADGTLLGEGLGVIVLKRLQDATRDRDRIYAIVKGAGQSSDGRGLGLLAPRLEGEVLAIQRAYDNTDIDPESVTLIEAHGTGIPLGDRTEIEALTKVMGSRTTKYPHCAIGSVKSMISHCIPAAGIAGIIKSVLALHYKVLPPTLCEQLNPELALDKTPFYINTETRPWIHASASPRRAGVDAFGFGGVNSHVVLEEYSDGNTEEVVLREWPSELFIFSGPDKKALFAQINKVETFLAASKDKSVTLAELAYTLATINCDGATRLAIVATSIEELEHKLAKARVKLESQDKRAFQSRIGIYFNENPFDGKTVFLFPGEGSQYQNMLCELLPAFPQARDWFDFWDGIYNKKCDALPSSIVFPPPNSVSVEDTKSAERVLHGVEVGSESVFISCQAIYSIFAGLNITPDAVVGHSSGENSALVAAGLIELADRDQLAQYINHLKAIYQQINETEKLENGTLMTVGAVERASVLQVVEQSKNKLHLALDNCEHQAVLFGSRAEIDKAAECFRAEGGLCSFLNIDRAYHTPLFEPVSDAIQRLNEKVEFNAGRVLAYSCVTAEKFPSDPDEIRRLTSIQWASRVRFTETIQKLYDDGFRNFVEIGPSSNLTGFVGDVLMGRDHVAVSTDSRTKSSLTQILSSLGRLFVRGVSMDVKNLFNGRHLDIVDLDKQVMAVPQNALRLSNTLPYVRLNESEVQRIRELFQSGARVATDNKDVRQDDVYETGVVDSEKVVSQHMELMKSFLEQQSRIIDATAGKISSKARDLPFVTRIVDLDENRAEVECDLSVPLHRYLQHHILYASQISDLDPDLHGLSVVPMAASLEILAEAASLPATQKALIAIENVRAHNWIALDHGEKTICVNAERINSEPGLEIFRTALYDGDALLLEGEIVFASEPPQVQATLPNLVNPVNSVLQDDQLYTTGMFHGSLFHSVKHLMAWGENGIDAELNDTPTDGFFYDNEIPRFLINPVLLDAIGHATAFWIFQSKRGDFSCFPSNVKRIDLITPAHEQTAGCTLRGRLGFLKPDGGNMFLEGDYEAVDVNGRVLFKIQGWRDRYFDVPHTFYYARNNPRDGWYGENWSSILGDEKLGVTVWCVPPFPEGFLEDAGAIWKRLLQHTLLSHNERFAFDSLPPNPRRRSEWLMGRVALKEAVRLWFAEHTGYLLYPADINVDIDENGKPYVINPMPDLIPEAPQVSLSHVQGYSIAAVAEPGRLVGIDIESLGRIQTQDFVHGAFGPGEREIIETMGGLESEETVLKMWCAKEAAAKCLGVGLNGRPHLFEVNNLNGNKEFTVQTPLNCYVRGQVTMYQNKVLAVAYDVFPFEQQNHSVSTLSPG